MGWAKGQSGNPIGGTKGQGSRGGQDVSITAVVKKRLRSIAPKRYQSIGIDPQDRRRRRRLLVEIFVDVLLEEGLINRKITILEKIWEMINAKPAQAIEGTDKPIQIIFRGVKIP